VPDRPSPSRAFRTARAGASCLGARLDESASGISSTIDADRIAEKDFNAGRQVVRRHHGFSSLEKWEAQRTVLYKLPVIKKTHGTVQKRKIDRMMRCVAFFARRSGLERAFFHV
jgi:hypothetical protein